MEKKVFKAVLYLRVGNKEQLSEKDVKSREPDIRQLLRQNRYGVIGTVPVVSRGETEPPFLNSFAVETKQRERLIAGDMANTKRGYGQCPKIREKGGGNKYKNDFRSKRRDRWPQNILRGDQR